MEKSPSSSSANQRTTWAMFNRYAAGLPEGKKQKMGGTWGYHVME